MPFTTTDKTYDFWTTEWAPVPAVYGIMNNRKQMIYIGETDDLKRRMSEHRLNRTHPMHRYAPVLVWAEVITAGETARRQRERQLIAEYAPPCNSLLA